jgi:beta-lactamase regulating signal transducer with metallopeptidase domain
MIAPEFQTVTQLSATRVLNTMFEGLALAGVSWLVLRLLARRSAVLRFAIWFCTLLAVVSMPLLMKSDSSMAWRPVGLQLSGSWATYLFISWALIAGPLLLRLALSLKHVRRLRRECRELARPDLRTLLQQNAVGRNVQLLVSDRVRMPIALGFFRPAVVLPSWTLNDLSSDELKVVLLHELAHLRRWDDWTNLAQQFLKALFFFHPAVWLIDNRLLLEREMACDDLVLAQTSNPQSYAASLISLAEKAFAEKARLQRTLVLAQNALGRMRQTSLRIAEIMNPVRRNYGWKSAMPIATGLMLAAFVAASHAPEVVSFRAAEPELSAISHTESLGTSGLAVPAFKTATRISRPAMKPMVIPAHMQMRHVNRPKITLAKARVKALPAAEVVLVSMRIDETGSAVWSVSVWRVPAGSRAARQLEETFVMNSI